MQKSTASSSLIILGIRRAKLKPVESFQNHTKIDILYYSYVDFFHFSTRELKYTSTHIPDIKAWPISGLQGSSWGRFEAELDLFSGSTSSRDPPDVQRPVFGTERGTSDGPRVNPPTQLPLASDSHSRTSFLPTEGSARDPATPRPRDTPETPPSHSKRHDVRRFAAVTDDVRRRVAASPPPISWRG